MLSIADVKRMAIGAGLDYNDLRVKQLAKAAYDLGCQHEREACARVCETADFDLVSDAGEYRQEFSFAIRGRNKE